MIRRFCIFVVKIWCTIFYHHKVYGKENIPPGGGIIAANHSSFLDPPMVGISYPGEVYFLARETLFKFRPFGWLIRQLNTYPLKRGKGNATIFKFATDLILNQKKVVLFPEGKRTRDGTFQKGKEGVSILVMRTGCMVIPTYIHGSYDIWNWSRKFPKLSGRSACVFGKPLYFQIGNEGKKEAQEKIAEEIMGAIQRLQEWYISGAKGSPP